MSQENNKKKEDIFNETFADLLSKSNSIQESPQEDLESVLFGTEEELPAMTDEEWQDAADSYIPESVGDPSWEAHASRAPLTPLNREAEANAVYLGLGEVRYIKQWVHSQHRSVINTLTNTYAVFPILFKSYFEETYSETHMKITEVLEDMEHFIAGDINEMAAVKQDFRLYQTYEERRLALLHRILEKYNK